MAEDTIAICIPAMVGWRPRSHGKEWGNRYRWHEILNVIKSMKRCDEPERLELSVYSLGSADPQEYEAMIRKFWDGPFAFGHESIEELKEKGVAAIRGDSDCLNVSYGLNRAAKQSISRRMFATYIDIVLPRHFVELYDNIVNKGTAWFPICMHTGRFDSWELGPHPVYRGWQSPSKGLVGITTQMWFAMGGYDEVNFPKWASDREFLNKCIAEPGLNIVRNRCKGLLHIDHPGTAVRASEYIRGRDWKAEFGEDFDESLYYPGTGILKEEFPI